MAIDKQKALLSAKKFYKKMSTLNGYVARSQYAKNYYTMWYKDIAKIDLAQNPAPMNSRILSFFRGNQEKRSIYLISPSISEINLFSSRFKTVYFSAIPALKGSFPANSIQLYYDKKFDLSKEQIKDLKVDYAYSHHVIEHIHPKDIKKHLVQVHSLLKPRGKYLIICPSSIRILKDSESKNRDHQLASYHHIGSYSYSSIKNIASQIGYRKFFKPPLNPNIINYFYPYNNTRWYDYLEKIAHFVPNTILSIIGFNSLYLLLEK